MNFVPLHCHSHYSLLDGLSKPSHIADRCRELGYKACAITDHGNIAGTVDFYKTLKGKDDKKQTYGVKPILGCELYLCNQHPTIQDKENPNTGHLVVLAKNRNGWNNLVKIMTECNRRDYFYSKPRIQRELLRPLAADLISFSGHMGSELANCLFYDHKQAYSSNIDIALAGLDVDWKKKAIALAKNYEEIFGKGNFFIEIQTINKTQNELNQYIGEMLREVSKATGIPCVATADSHYARKEQCEDHRVLLACNLGTTIPEIYKKIMKGEDVGLSGFFKSDNYHIPSYGEMAAVNTEEEIANTELIADMCEDYSILRNPIIPTIDMPPEFASDNDYLKKLCRDGMELLRGQDDLGYDDRLKMELETISKAGLSSYFLIVRDYVKFAKDKGYLVGAGRGSGAGCLISYLLGITSIDPLRYGLLFERFYNEGRNTADRISLPDIDCDFPGTKRAEIVDYLKSKYGHLNVGHISTFGTLQGRGALKEVMRARGGISNDLRNEITKLIPEKDKISDKLQEMQEEYGYSSIIQWALENQGSELSQWCTIDDDGKLDGDYSHIFAQAIRLEGTKRNQGIHASGIVISSGSPLGDLCPLAEKDGLTVCLMEMNSLEDMGLPKFDVLGVNLLTKIMTVQQRLLEIYNE